MDGSGQSGSATVSPRLDTGLVCLVMLARFHNVAVSAEQIAYEFERKLFTPDELLLAARKLGLKSRLVTTTLVRLANAPLPAIAIDGNGWAVAGAECNTVIELKPEHHAA